MAYLLISPRTGAALTRTLSSLAALDLSASPAGIAASIRAVVAEDGAGHSTWELIGSCGELTAWGTDSINPSTRWKFLKHADIDLAHIETQAAPESLPCRPK